jgi:hypothetical protein
VERFDRVAAAWPQITSLLTADPIGLKGFPRCSSHSYGTRITTKRFLDA